MLDADVELRDVDEVDTLEVDVLDSPKVVDEQA